jgi:choice-of-anchor A domain-containing protein
MKNYILSMFIYLMAMSAYIQGDVQPWYFNVYTIDGIGSQATPYGSDFQGIAGSGGNVYFQNFSLNNLNTNPSTGISLYTQGSTYFGSGSIENGGIESMGNVNLNNTSTFGNIISASNLQGNGGTVTGNVTLGGTNQSTITIQGTVQQNQSVSPSINYANINSYFQNASNFWGTQQQSKNWVNQYGQIVIDNLVSGRNVINMTAQEFNNAWGIKASGPSDAFLIINVDGVNLSGGLESVVFDLSGGLNLNNVLVNLPTATSVTLNGGGFSSLLAPLADITFNPGLLTGNLIAKTLFGSGQVNQGAFVGFSQDHGLNVPEPGTYLILGSFILLVVLVTARKKQAV